ncbi:MAG: hypothetical protein K6G76_11040, partial [Lachnospiraceae bacterium]|nr:hypothetical protein [Lachnospiraceae bacterium]
MKNKIFHLFESNGLVVDDSNKEIILYGLTKIFDALLIWIYTIACAGLMGDFLVGILFEAGYIPL